MINIDDKYIQSYTSTEKEEFNYSNSRSLVTQIPIVCAFKHTKEILKEGFVIERADKDLIKFTHKGFSIYKYLLKCYEFINDWAVVEDEEGGETYKKYDEIEAVASEEKLERKSIEISENLDMLIYDLNNKSRDELYKIQTNYAEQGIIEILVKLAELNYYKSTRIEERVEDLVGKSDFRIQAVRNLIQENLGEDEIRAEIIAYEYLTDLNDKILNIIYLLIRFNPENCNIITKYDEIIYGIKELPAKEDFTRYGFYVYSFL